MPNTGPSCLPSSLKVLRRLMLASRVSSHPKRSRPQDVPGSWSGLPLRTRGAEAKGRPDFPISNLPSSAQVWGRLSFPWKTMEGLLSLTKQRRKHLQKNEFRGITILFVEDSKGPRYSRALGLHLPGDSRYL